jgi:hypothetical protein
MMKIVLLGILAVGAMAHFQGFTDVLEDLDMAKRSHLFRGVQDTALCD